MENRYHVKLLGRAMRDLDEIYTYIAGSLLEPGAALKLVETIEQKILKLEFMSYRCSERRIGAYANRGYRQLLIKNYTVIYRVHEESKTVLIVTIRYSLSQF